MSLLKVLGADMLPGDFSYSDRFRMAMRAGFTMIEMGTVHDRAEAEEIREAADSSGLSIPSVVGFINGTRPAYLYGSPEYMERSRRAIEMTFDCAELWSCKTVLLVPALVTQDISYEEAFNGSQTNIQKYVIPLAEEKGLTVGIENTWYGSFLSPAEFARFIDELQSPRIRAYLDIGNMVFGYPQHWVRSLSDRICALHMKDFHMDRWGGQTYFAAIGEGSIDWPEVRRALRDVHFEGCVVTTGVPKRRMLKLANRAARSRYRDHLPKPCRRVLQSFRMRQYHRFLQDQNRRFDRFDQMA